VSRVEDKARVDAILDALSRDKSSYMEAAEELTALVVAARAGAYTHAAGLARRDGRADGLAEVFETLAVESA
jgi:hypothetical protein